MQLTAIAERITASARSTPNGRISVLPNAADKIGSTLYLPERRFVMSEEALETAFGTKVKSEPDGVGNARNQLRTGAGEIGRTKIASTFEALLDGLLHVLNHGRTSMYLAVVLLLFFAKFHQAERERG
jgi:hypothetical protein